MFGLLPFSTSSKTFWLPPQISTLAGGVDRLFYFLLYLCSFFFLAIVLAMVFFAIRYRRRSKDQTTSGVKGNLKIEILWSVIPAILLMIIFAWGYFGFLKINIPPGNTLDVRVQGQKWSWSFEYPKNGITSPELVVPVNQPVRLTMYSKDVIHSFFVPAFRIKKDLLPNRYTVLWFEATELGTYQIFCAEYCGTGHSQMLSKVKVLSSYDFEQWLVAGGEQAGGMSSVDFGKNLFTQQGCNACHTVDGKPLVGPTLFKKFGLTEKFTDGTSVKIDENYIRESLMDPNAKVVAGFPPVMPTYKGRLTDKQVNALIDYLKSLGEGS